MDLDRGSELKVRGGIEDNSENNFSYFSMKTYVSCHSQATKNIGK